jgi:hypothetical protein
VEQNLAIQQAITKEFFELWHKMLKNQEANKKVDIFNTPESEI